MTGLYEHLLRYDSDAWRKAVGFLDQSIAEIDRNATHIWFAFYPLKLQEALAAADAGADRAGVERKLGLMGHWGLEKTVDTSHKFLFAHQYWPHVKAAIAATDSWPSELAALTTQVADAAALNAKTDRDHVLGLTAIGLMTLRQVGVERFSASSGLVPPEARARSEARILKARAKDDFQGVFGFLRGIKKQWTVTFDEQEPSAKFITFQNQDLASGAQSDKREYRSTDARCIPNEGPIPVECRAASCGTCWVGVLGGAEKLSPVERHEAARMKVFGYVTQEVGTQPIVRLACQARAQGAVSIVIPPWNGIISRL